MAGSESAGEGATVPAGARCPTHAQVAVATCPRCGAFTCAACGEPPCAACRARGEAPKPRSSGRGATLVAAGIFLSRIAGLVRTVFFAHLFGTGVEAGAFAAATRIPNLLQNLLGEGVLSASFIPVYTGLRAQRRDADADEVAGAVFGLLSVVVAVLVALGVLAAPLLVTVIAPGYEGESKALTTALVRVIFPGTGVLVLSAWCLGILNSHRKFFLSYVAPVVWNGVMVAVLIAARHEPKPEAVTWLAWAFVLGAAAQFLVQVPNVKRLLGRFRPWPKVSPASVKQVLKGFLPAVASRGVVQISAYADNAYTSLISEHAVAALTNAQIWTTLPVSLFGMSISAAELPELSEDAVKSKDERAVAIKARMKAGLERMAFFVVPSAVAFVLLGDAIAGMFQSGAFTSADTRYVWYILMGAGVGLLAQTSGRLYSSAFYALKDTRTPFRIAALRVGLGVAVGYYAVRILPGQLGLPAHLGAVFVTVTTGVTAWLEMTLLRRALSEELGTLPSIRSRLVVLWGVAIASAGVAVGGKILLTSHFGPMKGVEAEWGGAVLAPPALNARLVGVGLLGVFGVLYFALGAALGVPQAQAVIRRILRRKG